MNNSEIIHLFNRKPGSCAGGALLFQYPRLANGHYMVPWNGQNNPDQSIGKNWGLSMKDRVQPLLLPINIKRFLVS